MQKVGFVLPQPLVKRLAETDWLARESLSRVPAGLLRRGKGRGFKSAIVSEALTMALAEIEARIEREGPAFLLKEGNDNGSLD